MRRYPKRVVFAEGEEEQVIRAAYSFVNQGLGSAILVGREDRVRRVATDAGFDLAEKGIEIHNARLSSRNSVYAQFLYERLQRRGFLFRDCQRLINQDRHYFAAPPAAVWEAGPQVTTLGAFRPVRASISARERDSAMRSASIFCASSPRSPSGGS